MGTLPRGSQEHPFGFVAKPRTKPDGSTDLLLWDCSVPGKEGTDWEGASFKLTLEFTADYPSKPPKAKFSPPLFHINCYPSGTVCLSILNEEDGWRPGVTVKQIMVGLQEWMNAPNPLSPAHGEAYALFTSDRAQYDRRIKEQTKRIAAAANK